MYRIIQNYCEEKSDHGLLLLDMPTGSGKTYSVLKYLFDVSQKEDDKKKYFFITSLKKNVQDPLRDLHDLFVSAGVPDDFERKVLYIKSNEDCIIDNFKTDLKDRIPNEFKKTDVYKNLERQVSFYELAQQSENSLSASLREAIRTKYEPEFRKWIEQRLAKEYPHLNSRMIAVRSEPKWSWVGELYPAAFTRDRKIVFMTMDKFLARNTPIVEPSYLFYASDVVKGSVVFIDEFDATKETILNSIIRSGLDKKIDYIELFKQIYGALQTTEFPTELTKPSEQHGKGKHAEKSLASIIDGIKIRAADVFTKYSLQYKFKTESDDHARKTFLFQDHKFHTILESGHYIHAVCSNSKRANLLSFSEQKPEKEDINLHQMFGSLRGFMKYLLVGVKILAENYMQRKQEGGSRDFSFEDSVRSVLNLLGLNDKYIDYLAEDVLTVEAESRDKYNSISLTRYDTSFYEKGFRYYGFEDDSDHDMQSCIMMFAFHMTPEKILLKICEFSKVIGISATASYETAIGNYDIAYIAARLGRFYKRLSEEDFERLKETLEDEQSAYKDINIHTELLGNPDGQYSNISWRNVFNNDIEFSIDAYDYVQRKHPNDRNSNNALRYLRITTAFQKFISHDDIHAFLCVLTKHPRINDNELDKDVLMYLFNNVVKSYGLSYKAEDMVRYIDGDNYQEKKGNVTSELSEGKKLFVISVYQTIGAGQNLQYRTPWGIYNNLVHIGTREERRFEKDYDAIYLDKPTNLLVNILNPGGIDPDQFVKAIFQDKYMQEVGDLSAGETLAEIRGAFQALTKTKVNKTPGNKWISSSLLGLSTRYLIQAIGRICRTKLKQKDIYIYADDRIADCIDMNVANHRLLNKEFIKLLECCKPKVPVSSRIEERAALVSERANADIRHLMEGDWNEDRIKKWKALRDLALRRPTMSKESAEQFCFPAYSYYIELPERGDCLYFEETDDYDNIKVSFAEKKGRLLSAGDARLTSFMAFDDIKAYFGREGYATVFEPNDYIMSPPLWNNIYKGALGEVVGRYLFLNDLNLKLCEINTPELFELFDYRDKSGKLYVDFKNWDEHTESTESEQFNKIIAKAKTCGCKCVIIANIITEDNNYGIVDKEIEGIRIVSIPSLLLASTHERNMQAWMKIKECVDTYADYDKQGDTGF